MVSDVKCYVNCDDAFIVWKIPARIPGLRGFAIARKRNGMEEILPTWVGPEGGSSQPGEHHPSTEWPVQKFLWTDYQVKGGEEVEYQVIPITGTFAGGGLAPRRDLASGWTTKQKVGPSGSGKVSAFFNRGIVAAQWVSRALGGGEEELLTKRRKLDTIVKKVGDPLRNFLAGPIRIKLLELLKDAANRGLKVYGALYELDDVELVPALMALKRKANIILANGSVKKKGQDQNSVERKKLKKVITLLDRMVAPTALGHNKFLVVCDKSGKPEKVWTGSTNWTLTGLCTQANNGVLIEDKKVAADFKQQWDLLKKSKNAFPDFLVESNSKARVYNLGESSLSLWFTRTSDEQDLDQARELINGAKKAILFLMFNPGPAGTLLNTIVERSSPTSPAFNANLYIHGVLNQDPSTEKNPIVGLFHRGRYEPVPLAVVLPAALDERLAYWIPELLKKNNAWAMVHSKVIVLDPFSNHPVVMTGSHNLGPKASGKNDENFLIIENDAALARAYAVNIMSIYNQYRWRFWTLQNPEAAGYRGTFDNDTWQDSYLKGDKAKEIDFWLGM
jgi:phosphatidylserine/phosphatidylglycerophosphate/cardiolipin synthase-like enzyme